MLELEITNTNDMWLDLTLLLSMHRNIDPTSIQHSRQIMGKLKYPTLGHQTSMYE